MSELDITKEVELQAAEALELQQQVTAQVEAIKQMQTTIDVLWANVEATMIDNEIKSIKGDWGSLTIAERLGFTIDETQLQPKFFKKVPDTKKIADTYRLEGKAPKGTEPKTTKYLTKRLKG